MHKIKFKGPGELFQLKQRKKPKPTAQEIVNEIFDAGFNADPFGLKIWCKHKKDQCSFNVLDVCGWGYFTGGGLGLDDETAIEVQKGIQSEVARRVNCYPQLQDVVNRNGKTIEEMTKRLAELEGKRNK